MTDIPKARRLLAQALQLITEAESLMTRPSPIRKASRTSEPCTPQLAKRIRIYAREYPNLSLDKIGRKFGVDGGRVSEALRRLR